MKWPNWLNWKTWFKHDVSGYHFSKITLSFADDRQVKQGETYDMRDYGKPVTTEPVICEIGMHASQRPDQAVLCMPIEISAVAVISKVTVHGVSLYNRLQRRNKFVGSSRTHIKVVKLDDLQRLHFSTLAYDVCTWEAGREERKRFNDFVEGLLCT